MSAKYADDAEAKVIAEREVESGIDPKLEKSLLRRQDIVLLPTLALIYLTHTLDRANLGNAKSGTLEHDLGLVGNQYNIVLILFYVSYTLFNIPAGILAKRFNPAVVVPILVTCWGALAMGTAGVKDFHGLLGCRFVMGIMEAGFIPCATFYTSLFYKREELSLRLSAFYMMGFIAGAISGLISWSVFQWHKALTGWRYLFIIEGAMTVGIGIWALLWLPRSVQSSWLFNEEQKQTASLRMASNKEEFSWTEGTKAMKDWKIWVFAVSALLYGVGVASSSNFLPVMIKRLTVSTIKANLYTLGPNLMAAVVQVATCYLSDRTQQRAWFSAGPIFISMIGWILLAALPLLHLPGVGYFLTYVQIFGTFTPAVLVPAWVAENTPSTSRRAVAISIVTMLQNLGGIVSSCVYREQDAPTYRPALITVAGCQFGFLVLCLALRQTYARLNRRLDEGTTKGVQGFRYIL